MLAPAVLEAQLAADRRDAAVDRGNRGGDHCAYSPIAAGSRRADDRAMAVIVLCADGSGQLSAETPLMSLWLDPAPLVLASRSAARRAMLTAAGIPIELTIADIDERAVEARAGPLERQRGGDAAGAREGPRGRAPKFPGRFVVGADQTSGARRAALSASRRIARRRAIN